ncbi:hypothetical protein [Streptomyces misionensis]|uniref:hypothetical protein n=1 Tax=Streptomyces misionensis TaxID=67331 RepID=UPI0036F8EEE7
MTKSLVAGRRSGPARRSVVLAGAAVLAGTAALCAPGAAYSAPRPAASPPAGPSSVSRSAGSASAATPVPAAGFRDCPALPDGVDPDRWRCEVHTAAPRLTMGKVSVQLAPITMTHAEGPLPDGGDGQVWGAMRTTPTTLPAAGPSPGMHLAIQPVYGGSSDFYTGRFSLRFRLLGPGPAPGCEIGASTPVDFRLTRSGPSTWVSQDPPLIEFSAYDDTFTVPAAEHCGPLTTVLDRRLGLPAAKGNLMTYDASYTFKTYDRLGWD